MGLFRPICRGPITSTSGDMYWMSLLATLALERFGNTRVFTSLPRRRVKGYLRSRSSRSRAMLICISPSMRRVESSSWSMRTASCTSAGEPTESEPKLEQRPYAGFSQSWRSRLSSPCKQTGTQREQERPLYRVPSSSCLYLPA